MINVATGLTPSHSADKSGDPYSFPFGCAHKSMFASSTSVSLSRMPTCLKLLLSFGTDEPKDEEIGVRLAGREMTIVVDILLL